MKLDIEQFTSEQKKVFDFAVALYEAAVVNGKDVSGIKLRSSQANVISCGRYTVLKSYDTIVCVIDTHTNTVIVGNYYSHTTAQHICKFIADYASVGYTRVNLYVPSDRVILHDTGTREIWKASRNGYVYQYAPKGGDK